MASPIKDSPNTEGTPTTSESPQVEDGSHLHPEIPYAIPHDEVNAFRRITRAYARQIGALPLALFLPHRKKTARPVVDTPDHTFVHMVEDLVYFSLTEIDQPLSFIPETPLVTPPTSTYSDVEDSESGGASSNSENSDIESDNMGDNNEEVPEVNDQPVNNHPWLARDSLALPGRLHHFPRHPEKLLPKFDPETSGLPEDHIKKFILAIRLMNVQHEDVVCRLFPYMFENSSSTWYFNLPVGSINSWMKFQKYFLDKFTEEMTIGALMAQLFSATMGPKEKFKDFNQRFTTILNKFQTDAKPAQELQIEVYANALPTSISMFVKRAAKPTLA
jgi:hypothetical protein